MSSWRQHPWLRCGVPTQTRILPGLWGGGHSRFVTGHPLLDAVLDVGDPFQSPGALLRFEGTLRKGKYDLAISLSRSPRMSAAVWLAGIPTRAGLDSNGRGFGYNIRAAVDPTARRHEAENLLGCGCGAGGGCNRNVSLCPRLKARRKWHCPNSQHKVSKRHTSL